MHTIKVSDIEIEVERKHIKNMHLAVYPPGVLYTSPSPRDS